MSARFWLVGMTMAGASLIGGLALGLYATTAPASAPVSIETAPLASTGSFQAEGGASYAASGPVVINCKGCGPTLSERRFAADMAGWDGSHDPLVQEYMTDDSSGSADDSSPTPAVQQRPVAIERLATGEPAVASPSPQWAQGGAGPPPVAGSTGSY